MLPAAGFRDFTNGALANRGVYGFYWSSKSTTATSSPYFRIDNNGLGLLGSSSITYAFSVRCIKDQSAVTVNGGSTNWNSSGDINLNTSF
ncbi:fibrobacter succinogenes major paralogous domain-containing protein [Elizabethkingia anophelis]|nr:hypothetical protein [Elizabethkingia anophelis]